MHSRCTANEKIDSNHSSVRLTIHAAVKQGVHEARFRNNSLVLERGIVADFQENVRACLSSANFKSYSDRI
jgi:hypothetical protein